MHDYSGSFWDYQKTNYMTEAFFRTKTRRELGHTNREKNIGGTK
jgi:hypothetical protein